MVATTRGDTARGRAHHQQYTVPGYGSYPCASDAHDNRDGHSRHGYVDHFGHVAPGDSHAVSHVYALAFTNACTDGHALPGQCEWELAGLSTYAGDRRELR